MLSISLGVSTSKTRTTAESTPTVRVYAGDRGVIAAAGDVEFAATASTQVAAKGTGISGTLGVAASGAEVTATLNPTVRAFTERTGSLGGRDVKLTADAQRRRQRQPDPADLRRRDARPGLRQGDARQRRRCSRAWPAAP